MEDALIAERDAVLEQLGLCYLVLEFLDERYATSDQYRRDVNTGLDYALKAVRSAFDENGFLDNFSKRRAQPSKVCRELRGLWSLYEALCGYVAADFIERDSFEASLDSIEELAGIRPAARVGDIFDNTLHDAKAYVAGIEGVIIQISHPGFIRIDGQVLIYARVSVGNGNES